MKWIRRLFVLLLCLPVWLRADLRLVFEVTKETQAAPAEENQSPPPPTTRKFQATVFLGARYLDFQDDTSRWLVDFAGHSNYSITLKDKQFSTDSVFSGLASRLEQWRQNLNLGTQMAVIAEIEYTPLDPVVLAHLLSLRRPGDKPLAPITAGPKVSFLYGKSLLFSWSKEGPALLPVEAREFVNFLRYQYGIHPDILAELQKAAIVPAEFDYYRQVGSTDQIHFHLVSAERVERAFSPAAIVAGLAEKTNPLQSLCASANALTAAQYQSVCDDLKAKAIAAAQAQKYLDAALLLLEFSLCTGQQMPAEFAPFQGPLAADADVKLLLASINPANQNEAEADLLALKVLGVKTQSGKRALKVFEANIRAVLRQFDEARARFSDALSGNPCLVGAWKDIGSVYFDQHDFESAWKCWDTGRKLLATYTTFAAVDAIEKKMETEHPEYFQ